MLGVDKDVKKKIKKKGYVVLGCWIKYWVWGGDVEKIGYKDEVIII